MAASSQLFKAMRIGTFEVSNRVVLAPLTRLRADDKHVPLPFVADYYAQRASYPGTLLLTEATSIAASRWVTQYSRHLQRSSDRGMEEGD